MSALGREMPLDLSKLMDSVRDDVRRLMEEAVDRTANYCATLCAERIVAARREMRLKRPSTLQSPIQSPAQRAFYTPRTSTQPTPTASTARLEPLAALLPPAAVATPPHGSFLSPPEQVARAESELMSANTSVAQLEERSHSAMQALQKLEEAVQAADCLTRTPHGTPPIRRGDLQQKSGAATPATATPLATPIPRAASPRGAAALQAESVRQAPEQQRKVTEANEFRPAARVANGFAGSTAPVAMDAPARAAEPIGAARAPAPDLSAVADMPCMPERSPARLREKSVESSVAPSLTGEDLAGC